MVGYYTVVDFYNNDWCYKLPSSQVSSDQENHGSPDL